MLSFSPSRTDFAPVGLLCLAGEEPSASPPELFALLLLLLPSVLTLLKLLLLLAERSHHQDADDEPTHEQIQSITHIQSSIRLILCLHRLLELLFFLLHHSFHQPDLRLDQFHPMLHDIGF